jgi:hypothetical protein
MSKKTIYKPDGIDGKLYPIKLGTLVEPTSAKFDGGFCRIESLGAASHFDGLKDALIDGGEDPRVGDVVYLDGWEVVGDNPLAEGDTVTPLELDEDDACWVTDRGRSASRNVFDKTTQCQAKRGDREYSYNALGDETGAISGLFAIGSDWQREIDSRFIERVVDDGDGKITRIGRKNTPLLTALSYRETSIAGEQEIWLFRTLFVTSVTTDAPQDGSVGFNLNYTAGWRKQVERTIPAAASTPAE